MRPLKEKTRLLVLDRDEYTCQECNSKMTNETLRSFDVHHIIPTRLGGTDDPENLITYCHKCHLRIEPREPRKEESRRVKNISFTIHHTVLSYIDKLRGDVPRSAFLRRLIATEMDKEVSK